MFLLKASQFMKFPYLWLTMDGFVVERKGEAKATTQMSRTRCVHWDGRHLPIQCGESLEGRRRRERLATRFPVSLIGKAQCYLGRKGSSDR